MPRSTGGHIPKNSAVLFALVAERCDGLTDPRTFSDVFPGKTHFVLSTRNSNSHAKAVRCEPLAFKRYPHGPVIGELYRLFARRNRLEMLWKYPVEVQRKAEEFERWSHTIQR